MAQVNIAIIGGGFAGLEAAKLLGKKTRPPLFSGKSSSPDVRITLIDRTNHHLFQPLLYQVATAGLSPADIAVPIRSVVAPYRNIEVILSEVTSVDATTKRIRLAQGDEVPYDFLLIGAGATHSYFSHPEWETAAPGLKTLEDATEIRRRVLTAFEEAELARDPAVRQEHLTFVVVGGGPTGVELAGAISELARFTLVSDFRRINPTQARILLVEAGPRILSNFPDELSSNAVKSLNHRGVEVSVDSLVTEITPDHVIAGGKRIATRTVIWAAGVKAASLVQTLGAPLDRAGRVLVTSDLSVPGHPEIFVAGDLASVPRDWQQPDGGSVPGVAPAAMQMGRHAARNILRHVRGEATLPFVYRDKGNLATIGRASAVADFGKIQLSGFFAWWMWLLVHIFFLVGFRSRTIVLFEWAWAYVTYGRGARLIIDSARRPPPESSTPRSGQDRTFRSKNRAS